MNKQNILISVFITILMVVTNLNLFAQKGDITLSFFGQDAATSNSISLEKVYVKNLTQDCDTTVFGAQPVLELSFIDGVNELSLIDNFQIEQNYPNPFINKTKFKLQLAKQQNIIVKLINIHGHTISKLNTKLLQGIHIFDVEIGNAGIYNIEISNNHVSKTIKIISNGGNTNNSFNIAYTGTDGNSNSFKNIINNRGFHFTPGDELQMTASAEGYPDNTITDSPIANTDYNYEMAPVPIAEFITNVTTSLSPGNIDFIDMSTNNPTSWFWDFGDGGASTVQNFTHSYLNSGTYTIKLIASNEYGSDTIIKENYITVKDVEIYCDTTSGYAPLLVNFTGASNLPNITSWHWDFGDGETSNEQSPSHTYLIHDSYYTVTLTITSESIDYTAEKNINVLHDLADVNFNADVINGWVPDQVVHFTGYCNMSNITAWQWSFGDGEGSYDQNPYHTYMAPGSYTVILSVYTTNGVKTETKEDFINIRYCPGNVMDAEGNIYETVGIDKLCWMKENLNMGTRINGVNNQTDNDVNEKYCYDDDEINCNQYGGLYQWEEVMQYETGAFIQGLCPDGWHVSNETDWDNLIGSLGGSYVAGESLKSTHGWLNNGNGTNSSEFTALPAGYRGYYGNFYDEAQSEIFLLSYWEPHFLNSSRAVKANSNYVGGFLGYLINGYSVRCVKNVTME